MSRNIEKWIGGAHGGSMMVDKEIDEIGRIGRLRNRTKME
jgi:hypothetical protein